jgi:hypothetical protein
MPGFFAALRMTSEWAQDDKRGAIEDLRFQISEQNEHFKFQSQSNNSAGPAVIDRRYSTWIPVPRLRGGDIPARE